MDVSQESTSTIKQECLEIKIKCEEVDLDIKEEPCLTDTLYEGDVDLPVVDEGSENLVTNNMENFNVDPAPIDIEFIKCEKQSIQSNEIDRNVEEVDPLLLTHDKDVNIRKESSHDSNLPFLSNDGNTNTNTMGLILQEETLQNMSKGVGNEWIINGHQQSSSLILLNMNSFGSVDNTVGTHLSNNTHKCSECSFSTTKKEYLVRHMRTHTGERPYKCAQCDYSAARSATLTKHVRTHSGEKPYKCSQCNYSGIEKSRLDQHIRIHSGEKPYKCSLCSYSAAQKSNMIGHMRTHSGEKPYKCPQCTYSAAEKANLVRHIKHHSGEKQYTCKHCNYSTNRKISVVEHMKIHFHEKL